MNVVALFGAVPPAVWAGWICANLIPYLSSLATAAPSWATGAITLFLSTATGFFSDWAAQGSNFHWEAALGSALVAWVIAIIHHGKLLKGTNLEADLHAFPRNRAPQTPAATTPPAQAAA